MVEWAGVNPETGAPQWYKHTKDENGNITGREITENYAEADQVICDASTRNCLVDSIQLLHGKTLI